MGRPWREVYKGGIYHVIARGNNKEYIFKENTDIRSITNIVSTLTVSIRGLDMFFKGDIKQCWCRMKGTCLSF